MAPLPAPRYVIWSCDPARLDPDDPWTRRWWIAEVLAHGRWEDIHQLDWDEVRRLLPVLRLPARVKGLWESYFARRQSGIGPDAAPAGSP